MIVIYHTRFAGGTYMTSRMVLNIASLAEMFKLTCFNDANLLNVCNNVYFKVPVSM